MRAKAGTVTVISLVALVVDFFTLENRLVTTSPLAQRFGLFLGLAALVGLIGGITAMISGGPGRLAARRVSAGSEPPLRAEPETTAPPAARARKSRFVQSRFRVAKILVGLLVPGSWFVGAPLYVHQTLLVNTPGSEAGPWVADAFLSVYTVVVQLMAPTPFALTFWPSAVMALYLLFSRKDRPVLDALFTIGAVGLVAGQWFMLLGSGRP